MRMSECDLFLAGIRRNNPVKMARQSQGGLAITGTTVPRNLTMG
jgi:hypothetical protein